MSKEAFHLTVGGASIAALCLFGSGLLAADAEVHEKVADQLSAVADAFHNQEDYDRSADFYFASSREYGAASTRFGQTALPLVPFVPAGVLLAYGVSGIIAERKPEDAEPPQVVEIL